MCSGAGICVCVCARVSLCACVSRCVRVRQRVLRFTECVPGQVHVFSESASAGVCCSVMQFVAVCLVPSNKTSNHFTECVLGQVCACDVCVRERVCFIKCVSVSGSLVSSDSTSRHSAECVLYTFDRICSGAGTCARPDCEWVCVLQYVAVC